MCEFKQELYLEKGVVKTIVNAHTFENKIEKVTMPNGDIIDVGDKDYKEFVKNILSGSVPPTVGLVQQ